MQGSTSWSVWGSKMDSQNRENFGCDGPRPGQKTEAIVFLSFGPLKLLFRRRRGAFLVNLGSKKRVKSNDVDDKEQDQDDDGFGQELPQNLPGTCQEPAVRWTPIAECL